SGNIKGPSSPFSVFNYEVVDPTTHTTLGFLNSESGQVTGTYKPGGLASNGSFTYTIPSFKANGQTQPAETFTLNWKGTITSTASTGIIVNGSEKIGNFSIDLSRQ